MPREKHIVAVLLLCVVALFTTALGLLILVTTWTEPETDAWGIRGTLVLFAITFTTVGAVVVGRRPANPIGWIYLGSGVNSAIQFLLEEYVNYGPAAPASLLPVVDLATWIGAWIWVPTVGVISTYPFLLFPDGRVPSRRWRPVAWLTAISILLMTSAFMVYPVPTKLSPSTASLVVIDPTLAGWLVAVGSIGMASSAVLSVAALLVRFRGARGAERQQLKWVASAGAFLAIGLVSAMIVAIFVEPRLGYTVKLDDIVLIVGIVGVPVAAGIAITRHGLWEIDLLINRALVYTFLTGTLLAFYLGSVVLLQYLFRTFTGQRSDLAIVISTLAIAAVFMPLRERIQHFIDRRFYRRKYDAARTLESFGASVRDEVDLPMLTSALVQVVRDTLQPGHVFLWVRPPSSGQSPDPEA